MTKGSQTAAPDTSTPTLPSRTCDECGAEYRITAKAFRRERRLRPDATPDTIFRIAADGQGWVFTDEWGQRVWVCPTCVGASKVGRAERTCPEWCVTDHAAENLMGEWNFGHRAPVDTGLIDVVRWNEGPIEVEVQGFETWALETPSEFDDVIAFLREHANDFRAAAEWLEAHRPDALPAGTMVPMPAPERADVDALRAVLDLMTDFADNDQRARYLLSSNWMRERLARRQSNAELLDALYVRMCSGVAK